MVKGLRSFDQNILKLENWTKRPINILSRINMHELHYLKKVLKEIEGKRSLIRFGRKIGSIKTNYQV